MQTTTLKQEFSKYAMLNILGMLGVSCYILADTFFIAQGTGAAGLTALNLAIPAYSLMHGVGLMAGIGGATRYAVCRAQNDPEGVQHAFFHAMLLALCVSAVCIATGVFGVTPLARLLGADTDMLPMTVTYLRVLLCFAPAFLLNDVLTAFVRNDGAPRTAMLGMLLGSLTNIILDYVLVFPCGLGIFGAALATGLSPLIGIAVLSRHLRSGACGFRLRKTRVQPCLIGAVCAPGLSALIGELATGFVLLLYNLVILRITGNTGVAAYGVVANLAIVGASIFTGAAQGAQPLVSRCFGHSDTNALRRLFRYAIVLALSIAAALYAAVLLFAQPLAAAFNSQHDPVLGALAVRGLHIYFTGFFCAGVNVVAAGFFSAAGQARQGFTISILRGLVAVIPLLLVLSSLFGMDGVWATFPVVEAATLCVTLVYAARHFRSL